MCEFRTVILKFSSQVCFKMAPWTCKPQGTWDYQREWWEIKRMIPLITVGVFPWKRALLNRKVNTFWAGSLCSSWAQYLIPGQFFIDQYMILTAKPNQKWQELVCSVRQAMSAKENNLWFCACTVFKGYSLQMQRLHDMNKITDFAAQNRLQWSESD